MSILLDENNTEVLDDNGQPLLDGFTEPSLYTGALITQAQLSKTVPYTAALSTGVNPRSLANHTVSMASYLPVGVAEYSGVSSVLEVNTTGLVLAGAQLVAITIHASIPSLLLPFGVAQHVTTIASSKSLLTGSLFAGVIAGAGEVNRTAESIAALYPGVSFQSLVGTITEVDTFGVLALDASLQASVSKLIDGTSRLDVGLWLQSPNTRSNTITAVLSTGTWAEIEVEHDTTTTGLLVVTAYPVSTVQTSFVIGTTGIQVIGVHPRALVSHELSTDSQLDIGSTLVAPVSRTAEIFAQLPLSLFSSTDALHIVEAPGLLNIGLKFNGDINHAQQIFAVLQVGVTGSTILGALVIYPPLTTKRWDSQRVTAKFIPVSD